MSPKPLSAVLKKLIRRLYLNDFPCGNGPWRPTKDDPDGIEKESIDDLLYLLRCPHSPWRHEDVSWSPQASELRELAVLEPSCLNTDFIHNYFTTLTIRGRDVLAIDSGLLKFSKLEELILSVNLISEIPTENLPSTLKVLELRANRLSSLSGLTNRPPPQLQYLSLASNSLGSHKDIRHLTGRHWPQLVCLDLSDCEFQEQRSLLTALKTLPRLRTLLLKGNPFTLAPAYPGFTVDSLPQLLCLDASWISSPETYRFRGLAKMDDLIEDVASVTVSLSWLRGIPDPLMIVDKKAKFPVITYRYFISYQFLSNHTSDNQGDDSESKLEAASHVTEDESIRSDLQPNVERQVSILDTRVSAVSTNETICEAAHLSQYRTSKLTWSDYMNLSYTLTHTVSSLGDLKRFFNQGLCLNLEEEKILSWPAAAEDVPLVKPSLTSKGKKGKKEEQVKPAPTKDKPKDKKSKCAPGLVEDPPIRRVLASAQVLLQSLVQGNQRVSVVCDLRPLNADSEVEAAQTQKDLERKLNGDKKEEDKKPKPGEGRSAAQRNSMALKGKHKDTRKPDVDDPTSLSVPVQQEPVTVELCVELEKWRTASEAHRLITPAQNV
ncbi:leucine-rich repeat-containing protein 43-like isoform X2 [Girardinichthys multiradiatus]|uniref:leucine-rich repeat-containing protein 43-like isoform X2 n=1 Tax=Girardinichthys multiradiatus TaxID=208333 RepID=UPI001FAC7E84|nr:leucine-rich repeat-containing protein 43-like isoform X2 [Girardinichthys multiradiatus]